MIPYLTGSNPVLTAKIKNMKSKFLKDLPIYLNGFAVGMLFFAIPNIHVIDIVMFTLAGATFIWFGKTRK
jgi:hypothetical protein